MKVNFIQRHGVLLLGLFCCLWASGEVRAQLQQYTPPGSLAQTPEERRERLQEAVRKAPWELGAFRLSPSLEIRDASYVDNVFGTRDDEAVSDFTLTISAGLRGFLPLGSKSILAAHALPEYVWWQDLERNRRWNGRYGAGYYGHFNRFVLELVGDWEESQNFVTPEVLQQITSRRENQQGLVEVGLTRNLWLFTGISFSSYRNLVDQLDERVASLDVLDRDEDVFRTGLRWHVSDQLRIGAGVERVETEFRDPTNSLSNEGSSPFLDASYEGARLQVRLDAVLRSLDPDGIGSRFTPYQDELEGVLRINYQLRPRLQLAVYGERSPSYSAANDYAYFTRENTGVSLVFTFGSSSNLQLYIEEGRHDYTAKLGRIGVAARQDDTMSFGAVAQLELTDSLTLRLGATESEYDSNLPGLDRSVTRIITGISLKLGGVDWP